MNSHSQASFTGAKHSHIPESYKVIKKLGEGAWGAVYRCLKPETNEEVAVKTTLKEPYNLKYEVRTNTKTEKLDEKHMHLDDIRVVIQQLAVALDGLKTVGLIHADLKMDNVMLVDHIKQPLRVKIIDFGMSFFRKRAKTGSVHQNVEGRAPELVFGLPFSESIDIWSLGCMMGTMLLFMLFFEGKSEYKALQNIITVLGPPPQRLLDAGLYTDDFFKKDRNSWTLKTPEEFKEGESDSQSDSEVLFEWKPLDEMMKYRPYLGDDPDDLRDCHPFITRSSASRSHSGPSTHGEHLQPAVPLNVPAVPSGDVTIQEIGKSPESSTIPCSAGMPQRGSLLMASSSTLSSQGALPAGHTLDQAPMGNIYHQLCL
uniref:Protein kinase domain-containing protein n=1 Tax=Salarias fasciatus TaxID=181472 RepID=A0A672GD77_SALFA